MLALELKDYIRKYIEENYYDLSLNDDNITTFNK